MKKLLSWLLAAAVPFLNVYPSFAQEKKDVKDPVLREIISQMSGKMPKFINKHGDSLFVEDEPVSRASLLSAFYEYDKSVSSSSKDSSYASRQDLDSLSKKIDALSKSAAEPKTNASAAAAKIDIVALINELDPNMPTLLDKNLKNSKVFRELQKQVSSSPGSKIPLNLLSVEKDFQNVNARIDDLSKKLDSVKSAANPSSSKSSQGADNSYVDREISDVNKRIDALSKKLDSVKNTPSSSASAAPASGVSAAYVDAEIADLNRKIEALSKQVNSSKPSPVDQVMQKDINRANKEIDSLTEKIASLSKTSAPSREIEEIKKSMQQIQQSYVNLSKRVDDLSAAVAFSTQKEKPEIIFINKQLEDIKKSISSVHKAGDFQKEISETQSGMDKKLRDLQKELDKAKNENQSEVEKKITEARREIIKTRSEAQSDIGRIEKKLDNVSSLRERGKADSASASTIATISLGLAMVAGLLAAR
jgi:chromosome segregation ATPase